MQHEQPFFYILTNTRAIAQNENYADAYLMRAHLLLERGETDAAEKDCQWLMERAADVEDVLILKAQVEIAKGNYSEALTCYNKVIEQNPFSIEGYRERAELKRNTGDQHGAEEDLAKLQEIENTEE